MEKNTKLEQYLGKLEKGLGQIPVSEKAEIITEIKSHILDAQAKDETKKLDDILSAIGEPELVANRYLLERGLKPMKAPTHPIFKWLIIGFLGTFVVAILFVTLIIWKFTPIVKVQNDKVTLLGGAIDIDDKSEFSFDKSVTFSKDVKVEEKTFDASKVKTINIQSGSGDITVEPSKDNKVVINVARKGNNCELVTKLSDGELLVTTSGRWGCSLVSVKANVLPGTNVKIRTGSGDILVSGLNADVVAKTGSGDITLSPKVKGKANIDVMTGSGDVSVALPDRTAVDYTFRTGSGNINNDFANTKGANIRMVVGTGSGDINLKIKR